MNVIAVVGCSADASRPSHRVAAYLLDVGYRIVPVNPNHEEILGETCYPDLKSIPDPIDAIDVFRRAEHVPAIVDEAIAIGAKGLWLQDGIEAPEAADKARAGGLKVVEDDCFMRQHISRCGR